MNEDLEARLRTLKLQPLPVEWRQQILPPLRHSPPRWLVTGWALAWAAVLLLYLTTPEPPQRKAEPSLSSSQLTPFFQRAALMQSLLAAN